MSELFDLYGHDRRPLGRTGERGMAMPADTWRIVVHVCLFNARGQLLIQQRQPFKQGWPGLWDLSAGGSVLAGESSQQAASRELREEIGYTHDFAGQAPAMSLSFATGMVQGFDDHYVLRADVDLEALRLQPSEVQAVRWAGLEDVLAMIDAGHFIPYHTGLIGFLFHRGQGGSTHCPPPVSGAPCERVSDA